LRSRFDAGQLPDSVCGAPTRIAEEATARKLMAAMADVVKRGTAIRIANALAGT